MSLARAGSFGRGSALALLLMTACGIASPLLAAQDDFLANRETAERTAADPRRAPSRYAPFVARPLEKLSRGTINVLTAPLELPRTVDAVRRDQGWVSGITRGIAQGVARIGLRLASGIADLATFPVPPNEARWIQPAYVFANQGELVYLDPMPPTRPPPGLPPSYTYRASAPVPPIGDDASATTR